MTYQWRHRGEPIPGANEATLFLPEVHSVHGGAYDVVIENPYGSVVSEEARLIVLLGSGEQFAAPGA